MIKVSAPVETKGIRTSHWLNSAMLLSFCKAEVRSVNYRGSWTVSCETQLVHKLKVIILVDRNMSVFLMTMYTNIGYVHH